MAILISSGKHTLEHSARDYPLPYQWFEQHDIAQGRDDGMIYIGGFSTRERAEAWAVRRGIMPDINHSDPQGEL